MFDSLLNKYFYKLNYVLHIRHETIKQPLLQGSTFAACNKNSYHAFAACTDKI